MPRKRQQTSFDATPGTEGVELLNENVFIRVDMEVGVSDEVQYSLASTGLMVRTTPTVSVH